MTFCHTSSARDGRSAVNTEQLVSPELDPKVFSGISTPQVLRLESKPYTSSDRDRLNGTRIGRLYARYIRIIPRIHHLVVRVWRVLYPKYTRYVASIFLPYDVKKWRTLVSLQDYVTNNKISTVEALSESIAAANAAKVFSADSQAYLLPEQDPNRKFPKVYVAQVGSAVVHGGTNLVFQGCRVIHHDLYDFQRDYTSEELGGRHVIDAKSNRMRLLLADSDPFKLPLAASFLDACAPNYAHWLTEVLTRIAAFCSLDQYAHVPLIVDERLHANIMQSLYVIAGSNRQIIVLPVGRAIEVGNLLVTSVAGYVPFERRNKRLAGHSHGSFSSLALKLLRTRVFSYINKISPERFPTKIYLARGHSYRSVTNEDQITKSLIQLGFISVRLETISFIQQAALFKHAKIVVGPTGAALANLIFSEPDQSVHILIANHPEMPYSYWPRMTSVSGLSVNYILGVAPNLTQGVHSDFYVELGNIFQSISGAQRT